MLSLGSHSFDPDAWCHGHVVNYTSRVDDPGHFNFCPVPEKGFDALAYMSVALLVAAVLQGKLSALLVLIAGGVLQGVAYQFNLGFLGNAINLWLGIEPAELFLYGFLPPLLMDSTTHIEMFMFRKVALKVMVFAFLVVLSTTALMVPLMLYGFGLAALWNWAQAALFVSIIASTDAVTVNALLKSGGGPEEMVVMMEGESLFNDASSMVLFTIFFELVKRAQVTGTAGPVMEQLPVIGGKVLWLASGGAVVGYALGYITRKTVVWMQSRGCKPAQEVAIIVAMGYGAFYLGQAVLDVSGVIAVVVFGLYGSKTGKWEISTKALDGGAFSGFMESLSFGINGIVFFYAGSSAVNFMIRSIDVLMDHGLWWNVALMVFIYIAMFVGRFLCIAFYNMFFALVGEALPWNVMFFATIGGLRGALSLIMAQVVIQEKARQNEESGQSEEMQIDIVTAQMVLWSAGFVLMTLLINAPLMPWFMAITGLTKVSDASNIVRSKAKRALLRFTDTAIQDLRNDEDEMLRGVDWNQVRQYTDMSAALAFFGVEENPKHDDSLDQSAASSGSFIKTVMRGVSTAKRPPAGAEQLLREPLLAPGPDVEAGPRVVATRAARSPTAKPWATSSAASCHWSTRSSASKARPSRPAARLPPRRTQMPQ